MTRPTPLTCAVLLSGLLAACGAESRSVADHCNPLSNSACLMPWPSSAYLLEDSSSATGYRVSLPVEAMPINLREESIDPAPWNRYDGFSPSGAMIAEFSGGVSDEGLPGAEEIERSLAADSPIVVVSEEGERVPFFAEVDKNSGSPQVATLLIRPVVRMQPATRYFVAIRDSVRSADGGALERTPGFEDLVAGAASKHARWDAVGAAAESMFETLEGEGVSRDELVLAWDFVTASDEFLTSDLLHMRRLALESFGADGENLSFAADLVETENPAILRRLEGTFEAPRFLDRAEEDGSRLMRDADGKPAMLGTYGASFAALVPACALERDRPLPVVVFGHGLFGTAAKTLASGLVPEVANDYCFIVVASDWIGLSEGQVGLAFAATADLNKGHSLFEMLPQGVINFITLEHLARRVLVESDFFVIDGESIIDPERIYYLGASLGGIMGGTFMAYDPIIERGALGVPGGAWSMLIERSFAWSVLQNQTLNSYRDPHHYQIIVALLALALEPWDPITTAPRVLSDPLPDTPAKQLLVYEAVNDSLVTNLSTHLMARALKIPVTAPSVLQPWGLEAASEPIASALTIYDERVAPPPETNVPPLDDNGTHGGINERAAVMRQVNRFLREGIVVHGCSKGEVAEPCDCGTGVCD